VDPKRELLRHALATIAYRGGKTMRGAPPDFAAFRPAEGSRAAGEILAHIGDLFEWALWLAKGSHVWHDSTPLAWEREVARFFDALAALDAHLSSGVPIDATPEQLLQGPIADAMTHIGQLAMLRRMAGSPVRGENYYKAEIVAGRIGRDQPAPRREFD
jgi:hypothetical protein